MIKEEEVEACQSSTTLHQALLSTASIILFPKHPFHLPLQLRAEMEAKQHPATTWRNSVSCSSRSAAHKRVPKSFNIIPFFRMLSATVELKRLGGTMVRYVVCQFPSLFIYFLCTLELRYNVNAFMDNLQYSRDEIFPLQIWVKTAEVFGSWPPSRFIFSN